MRDAVLIGDGAVEYESLIADAAGFAVTVVGRSHMAPSAEAACRLAERDGMDRAVASADLVAVYLRGADVQLGWPTREGDRRLERTEVG